MKFTNVLMVSLLIAGTTFSSYAASPRQLVRMIVELGAGLRAGPSAKIISESAQSSAFANAFVSGGRKVWTKLGHKRGAGDIFLSVDRDPQIFFVKPGVNKEKIARRIYFTAPEAVVHRDNILTNNWNDLMKLNSDIDAYNLPVRTRALSEAALMRGANGRDYSVVKFALKREDVAKLDLSEFSEVIENLSKAE